LADDVTPPGHWVERPEMELRFPVTRAWTSGPERNQSTVAGIKGGVSGRLQLLDHRTQQAARETVASE